ncbi:hypothetical protein BJY00DRAFT_302317 [Aspergillus carlsbadensis]|nr:hypothetical protein BJY00DRAFT_302317 [Aspergillus carlsbadensis]
MDPNMRRDCLNVTHLVHCDLVFVDKKQQLYPLVDLNLSSISACRAVSLFDTRHAVNPRPDGTFGLPDLSDGFSSDPGYDTGITGGQELTSEMHDDEFNLDYKKPDGYTSDGSTVTDDSYLAGNKEAGTIMWRHVEFYIIHNPRFAIKHEDNLLFNLLLQLLALGIDDNIFMAIIQDVADIYIVLLPYY